MKWIIILFNLLIAQIAFTQDIELSLLSSGGEFFEDSQISLEWSIGEVLMQSLIVEDIDLQGGFIQKVDSETSTAISTFSLDTEIILAPIPTIDMLAIKTSSESSFQFLILDVVGQLVDRGIFKTNMDVDLTELEPGIYFLYLITRTGEEGIFPIVKL